MKPPLSSLFVVLSLAFVALGALVVALLWVLELVDKRRADLKRARRPTPQPIQLPPAIAIPTAYRQMNDRERMVRALTRLGRRDPLRPQS